MVRPGFCAIALLTAACASAPPTRRAPAAEFLPPDVEAMSLLGEPLVRPALAPAVEKQRQEQLEVAQRDYDAHPESAEAIIELGRRTAYLGRYREAIAIFTDGIRKHPDDARLYRQRGFRYITVRRFADAVNDLKFASLLLRGRADEPEPEAEETAGPPSSLRSNIDYQLGLAYFLEGDFDDAVSAYRKCLGLSNNPDRVVAASQWLYTALRRLGRAEEAEKVLQPISISMDVVASVPYHKLLLMESGEIAPQELTQQDPNSVDGVTILYGIGSWYYDGGQPEKAVPFWERVVHGSQWPAFGYIAAEADLARVGVRASLYPNFHAE